MEAERTLLIVEDRESISGVIRDMLSAYGDHVIMTATSGGEAMRIFNDSKPEIVLMDILLPDMNGLDVTREMLEARPGTTIIAMSAMADDDLRERSKEAGCVDLLVKPFRMKELMQMMDAVGL